MTVFGMNFVRTSCPTTVKGQMTDSSSMRSRWRKLILTNIAFVSVNKNTKTKRGQYSASSVNNVKYSFYGHMENFYLWDQHGKSRKGKMTPSGSQSERRICFILPACGFGQIINQINSTDKTESFFFPSRRLLYQCWYRNSLSHLQGHPTRI